jgi:UDP-N-acetylglucosamine--N-acetylmuramyl-(pentapeptide) pyrophosphoryl-undecaprenol N-acetylglucosamine transferase
LAELVAIRSTPTLDRSPSSSLADLFRGGALRLAIAGGGTGGHIVPGLHLCRSVLAEPRTPRGGNAGTSGAGAALGDVLWLTSGRSVESRVLAGLQDQLAGTTWERVALDLERKGGGAPSRPTLLVRSGPAVLRARRALQAHASDVLLGLGGFTCLPAVLASRSLGIPVALLEMNAVPGSATRWLAPFARRVLHVWRGSVPAAEAARPSPTHVHVGPPLDPEFAPRAIPPAEVAGARAELGFDPDRPLLVVLGGSQGASALNRFVRAEAPALVRGGLQILHQTGPGKLEEGRGELSGYRAVEYVGPVHRALAAATLVLTRGGASTLAEIAAIGRPAIVVPYPHHTDRHQERNARELGEGVLILAESELRARGRSEVERLASTSARDVRERMTTALRDVLPADGASRLFAVLASIARRRCP